LRRGDNDGGRVLSDGDGRQIELKLSLLDLLLGWYGEG